MKIAIGSKNPIKIEAVKEVFNESVLFKNAEYFSFKIDNEVSEQPKSLEETIRGAKNRSEKSIKNFSSSSNYGVGIESGLISMFTSNYRMLDVCVCSIFHKHNFHIGLSSGFEVPPPILKLVHKEGLNLSQACLKLGLTSKEYVGYEEGLIGILTDGKINRKDYTKQAIQMALISIEKSKFYLKYFK